MARIKKLLLLHQQQILLLIHLRKRRSSLKNRYAKRMWVRNIFKEREQKGEFNMLVRDLKLFDNEYFFSTPRYK